MRFIAHDEFARIIAAAAGGFLLLLIVTGGLFLVLRSKRAAVVAPPQAMNQPAAMPPVAVPGMPPVPAPATIVPPQTWSVEVDAPAERPAFDPNVKVEVRVAGQSGLRAEAGG